MGNKISLGETGTLKNEPSSFKSNIGSHIILKHEPKNSHLSCNKSRKMFTCFRTARLNQKVQHLHKTFTSTPKNISIIRLNQFNLIIKFPVCISPAFLQGSITRVCDSKLTPEYTSQMTVACWESGTTTNVVTVIYKLWSSNIKAAILCFSVVRRPNECLKPYYFSFRIQRKRLSISFPQAYCDVETCNLVNKLRSQLAHTER